MKAVLCVYYTIYIARQVLRKGCACIADLVQMKKLGPLIQKRGKPYYQRQVLKIRDDCFFFESYTMFFFSVALVIALKHPFLQPSFLANLYEFKGACLILPYNTKSGRGVLYTHTPLPCLLHLSQSESLSLRHFLMTKVTEASL